MKLFFFRILGGTADAAAMGAMLAILMKLYPGKTGKIVAWTGSASGVGHMLGWLFFFVGKNILENSLLKRLNHPSVRIPILKIKYKIFKIPYLDRVW